MSAHRDNKDSIFCKASSMQNDVSKHDKENTKDTKVTK